METIREYVIFLNPGNDIVHNGTRLGTPEMLRADFPGAAIVPADEVPANWQEMTVQNGQLVPASAEVLAARRQAETARIQQEMGLTERIVPGEFWLDADGATKRQVYQRTFVGTTSKSTSLSSRFTYLSPNINCIRAEVCGGYIDIPDTSGSGTYRASQKSSSVYSNVTNRYYWLVQPYNGALLLSWIDEAVDECPYSITLKYTKA